MVEKLYQGIQKTKIIAPPVDCISPIGAEELERGLRKEINAEFYCSTTRPASVYRGNPFVVEAAIAFGGEQEADSIVRIIRFANRVPLLYQQGACGITNAIQNTSWKSYGLLQSKSSLPSGPCTILVHMSSVWVPFTSESKEALAHYEDIIKEIKLALQECGRKLASFINKKKRIGEEAKKRGYIEKYIPIVADSLREIIGLNDARKKEIEEHLFALLKHTRGELEEVGIDNPDYDPELAKIGQDEDEPEEVEEIEAKDLKKGKKKKKSDDEEGDEQTKLW